MKTIKAILHFLFIDFILALLLAGFRFTLLILVTLLKVIGISFKLFIKFILNSLYYLAKIIIWPFKNCFPPKSIDQLSGLEFETFCTKWLALEGYRSIIKTPSSSDYGVDILTEKDNERIGIQCKRYSGNVGVGAIQEITAGMPYYECDKGLVITNSKFTKNAQDLAEANNIDLIDGNYLLNSKNCQLLTQNRWSMRISLVIMFLFILINISFCFMCLISARPFLPLAVMFLGICIMSFINGFLELNYRKKSENEEPPFEIVDLKTEQELFEHN